MNLKKNKNNTKNIHKMKNELNDYSNYFQKLYKKRAPYNQQLNL